MCNHEWEPFTDLPGGVDLTRYKQCRLCKNIGLARLNGFTGRDRGFSNMQILLCSARSCHETATGRNWGVDNRGRVRWVCEAHKSR